MEPENNLVNQGTPSSQLPTFMCCFYSTCGNATPFSHCPCVWECSSRMRKWPRTKNALPTWRGGVHCFRRWSCAHCPFLGPPYSQWSEAPDKDQRWSLSPGTRPEIACLKQHWGQVLFISPLSTSKLRKYYLSTLHAIQLSMYKSTWKFL